MEKLYKGVIIEESLDDNRTLNDFWIRSVHISDDENPLDRWHIYEVDATEEQLFVLADHLKIGKWYTHFWSGDDMFVVFPKKIFRVDASERASWDEMLDYARSLWIPEEQLDFPTD